MAKKWCHHGWPTALVSVTSMIDAVAARRIPGDVVECGVWRGGTCVYARLCLDLFGLEDRRVHVADSFRGLPIPRTDSLRPDEAAYARHNATLAVSLEQVRASFVAFGLQDRLDKDVHFHRGYFNESLPRIRHLFQKDSSISLLRMDGDMYDSTVDILYNLYESVSVGGFVVVDDWRWEDGAAKISFGAQEACIDFRVVHGIEDTEHAMVRIGFYGAYWVKARSIDVQRSRHTDVPHRYRPDTPLTPEDYQQLRLAWEAAANVSGTIER